MLDKKLLDYAIKGVAAEIDTLEKDINRGKQYLLQYERGEKPKTSKSEYEIHDIIKEKKAEIEKLAAYKDDLKWKLVDFEQ